MHTLNMRCSVHHQFRTYIRHPFGRWVIVLMLFAQLLAGIPSGKIHSHADGDLKHDHDYEASELLKSLPSNPSVSLDSDIESPEVTMLHVHDSAASLPALLIYAQVVEPMDFPAQVKIPLSFLSRPSATPPPPYRPPIA